MTRATDPSVIFTVGHSHHPIEHFSTILRGTGIQVVTDVRSSPYSRFSPQYNSQDLRRSLGAISVQYVRLGAELGGRPEDRSLYDPDGHVNYERLAASGAFQRGIERLVEGASRYRVAILCGEEDPTDWHRRLLVGRVIALRGFEIMHIRRDGRLEDEASVTARERIDHPDRYQSSLFGRKQEEWRSIRSVSGSTARRTSSAP